MSRKPDSSPPEELVLETPALRMAALAWGPAGGEPVLALHGWLDNANSFVPIAPDLAAGGMRLVALDLPGHGLSDPRPPGVAYHFVDWFPDVFEAADALGWERFSIIGHSMGAGIASMCAGVVPDRIARLVLLEGLGPQAGEDHEGPGRVAQYLIERKRLPRRNPLPHEDRSAAAARLAKVVPNLSLSSAELLVARGTRDVDGGVLWRADPRLRRTSPHRYTEGQVHAFLNAITAPTLLVWAEDGWSFDVAAIEARVRAIPNVRTQRLSGGHHLHMEDPETVAGAIRSFFGV